MAKRLKISTIANDPYTYREECADTDAEDRLRAIIKRCDVHCSMRPDDIYEKLLCVMERAEDSLREVSYWADMVRYGGDAYS